MIIKPRICPRYQNQLKHPNVCHFIRQYEVYDVWYYCNNDPYETIIFRFGDDTGDYIQYSLTDDRSRKRTLDEIPQEIIAPIINEIGPYREQWKQEFLESIR